MRIIDQYTGKNNRICPICCDPCYKACFDDCKKRCQKCIAVGGDYFEGVAINIEPIN